MLVLHLLPSSPFQIPLVDHYSTQYDCIPGGGFSLFITTPIFAADVPDFVIPNNKYLKNKVKSKITNKPSQKAYILICMCVCVLLLLLFFGVFLGGGAVALIEK